MSLLGLAAAAALAQPALSPDLTVHPLGPQVELLSGQGPVSNMTLGWTGEEAVLVDTGLKEITPALVAELRRRNPSGRLTVINTHWHFDHVGSNAELGRAGTVILAQTDAARRMGIGGDADIGTHHLHADPVPKSGLPGRTFDTTTSLRLGDEEILIFHPQHAHTDGDTLVKWTNANVLNTGDVFVRGGFPILDVQAGGSLEGEIAAIEMALGVCDSKTVVIPGHGNPATCQDLKEFHDRLTTIAVPLRQAITEGRSLDQVQAMHLADGWKQTQIFFSGADFIAMAYRGYSSSKASK